MYEQHSIKNPFLHPYQKVAIKKCLENEGVGIFLKPGLGKTVIALTAIEILMHDSFEISKTLVIAPKRVCEDVWPDEITKWSHLSLSYSLIVGPPNKRLEALKKEADVYIVSRDNILWLVKTLLSKETKLTWMFDLVVIDELSNFKNRSTSRFKALQLVRPKIKRVIGLTGTPKPNSDLDLWAELYLLDMGQRLGKGITAFKEKYFTRPYPYLPYVWEIKSKEASEEILNKISDICLTMKAEDYIHLEPLQTINRLVTLPPKAIGHYKKLEREMIMELNDQVVTATSKAIVINKCLQLASGYIYDDEHKTIKIHDAKIEALLELIEEANGEPILIFYSYQHEKEGIIEAIESKLGIKPRQLANTGDLSDWNDKKVQILIAHPQSCGYGLNLQMGGHLIIWFSLTWSQEQYEQANARLHRQGQKEPVIVYRLIASSTADELVRKALEKKNCNQERLFEALKAGVISLERKKN